jgi:hypothetical protein
MILVPYRTGTHRKFLFFFFQAKSVGQATLLLHHPFMLTMCGPTQCGKTKLIVNIIKNIDKVIVPTPNKLLYLYTAEQPDYDDIKQIVRDKRETSKLKLCEFVDCNGGVPTMDMLKNKLGDATLLVLDDLMVIVASENVKNLILSCS